MEELVIGLSLGSWAVYEYFLYFHSASKFLREENSFIHYIIDPKEEPIEIDNVKNDVEDIG